MNICEAKYFEGLEFTRNDTANVLKNLLFDCTFDEARKLEKSRELPPCILLIIKMLILDIDAGRCDTMNIILDSVF